MISESDIEGEGEAFMPGVALRNLLAEIIPLVSSSEKSDEDYISRMNTLIESNGEFRELSYESRLNYLVRRLPGPVNYGYFAGKRCRYV